MSFDYYKDRTDWFPVNAGNANVSHYVFHDVNRNGIYDIGDKPLIQFAIRLTREDGSWAVRRSNLNGFVNFYNAIVDEDSEAAKKVEIRKPGVYTYEIILPDGWYVTTQNAVQKITYTELPGTRAGIVCDTVPVPIGVAQILTVSGSIVKKNENGTVDVANNSDVEVIVTSPAGKQEQIQLNDQGQYSFVGEPGIWKVNYHSSLGNHERIFELKTAPVKACRVVLGSEENNIGHKTIVNIVDFENITNRTVQKTPNGVGGVNWKNLNIIHHMFEGEGYSNGTVSGEYVAYNTSGYPVTIELPEGFDFYGAYFTAAWLHNGQGETLEVKAWRDDQLIADEEFKLSALGPFWLDADFRNITKLVLSTKHYWQFVVDDMKFGV